MPLPTTAGTPGRRITLIGTDGAGKTTVAKRVCAAFDGRARYVYLGSNPESATHTLPTTKLWQWMKKIARRRTPRPGPPEVRDNPRSRPTRWTERWARHLKSLVTLVLRVSEEVYRLVTAWAYGRRADLVVLDRHPFPDYYDRRIARSGGWQRIGDRIHGFLLEHAYPRPPSPVLLSAPTDVLYARKPEGTRAEVDARRLEYERVAERLEGLVVVDASQSEDAVVAEVLRIAGPANRPRSESSRSRRRDPALP